MLIPNDSIKKINLVCDKKTVNLIKRKKYILKTILVILLISFLFVLIKNQDILLS